MDKFNLQGYLKNNQLLNENIGGYVDIKPMKEELGTAMEEYNEKDSMIFGKDWEYEDEDGDMESGTNDERIMGLGGDQLLSAAQFLVDDGYEIEDVIDFLRKNLK